MVTQNEINIVPGGILNKPCFLRVRSWPIWGGKWSYLVVETDPGQELECICVIRSSDSLENRDNAFSSPVSSTLKEMLTTLAKRYPPDENHIIGRKRLVSDLLNRKAKYLEHNSAAEFEEAEEKCLQVFEWKRILNAVSPAEKAALAAWNRSERDQAYQESMSLSFMSPLIRWYINFSIQAITEQENRWCDGVSMNPGERSLFWLWNFLMILGVIIPDVINFSLMALLAVIRSLPTRPQGLCMAVAIMDFPFADERLSRTVLFQRFLGALPTIILGIVATFNPQYRATAFRGFKQLWWKALMAIIWQVAMQNWKNVFDLIFKTLTRFRRLPERQIGEVRNLLKRLELCNAYQYAWFEMYNQGNRFRAQISNYKQDHADITNSLWWLARLTRHDIVSEDFSSKFATWIATALIGTVICASTFPIDSYAGLIALAYYSNVTIKMMLDVWDSSQSYEDVLRFFTATVGPTFPSTLILMANLIHWGVKRTEIFGGMGLLFWIVLVILFILSLYPKFWGEMFKRLGLWLRSPSIRLRPSRNMEVQQRLASNK